MARTMTAAHYYLAAGELNAIDHIGRTIRVRQWDGAHEMVTVTTAELRQISHNGAETHLTIGYGAEREITLTHAHLVSVNPPANYADMTQLVDAGTDGKAEEAAE